MPLMTPCKISSVIRLTKIMIIKMTFMSKIIQTYLNTFKLATQYKKKKEKRKKFTNKNY